MNTELHKKLAAAEASLAAAIQAYRKTQRALLDANRQQRCDIAEAKAEHAARNEVSIAIVNRNAARERAARA